MRRGGRREEGKGRRGRRRRGGGKERGEGEEGGRERRGRRYYHMCICTEREYRHCCASILGEEDIVTCVSVHGDIVQVPPIKHFV